MPSIKAINYKNKWISEIISCDKPNDILGVIKHDAKFLHESGSYIANIYKTNESDWGFFNSCEYSTNSKGEGLFSSIHHHGRIYRIENVPNDKWYKFKINKENKYDGEYDH